MYSNDEFSSSLIKMNNYLSKKLLKLLLIWVVFFMSIVLPLYSQEDHSHDHGAPKEAIDTLSKHSIKKKGPFKGYGKYFSSFKLLCDAINQDHRVDILVKNAKEFSDRDPNCPACRPFMQAITTNCKFFPKKETSSKKIKEKSQKDIEQDDPNLEPQTPTAMPIIPQIDPSALVIDRAVKLFESIALDEDIREPTKQALNKLKFVLFDKTRSTNTSRIYYDTLFSYIYLCFDQHKNSKQAIQDNGYNNSDSLANVDSLFQ